MLQDRQDQTYLRPRAKTISEDTCQSRGGAIDVFNGAQNLIGQTGKTTMGGQQWRLQLWARPAIPAVR